MIACRRVVAALLIGVVAGCQTAPEPGQAVKPRQFGLGDIAKGDIDLVAEISVQQSLAYLRELARKLYVRNPRELQRGGDRTRSEALQALFGPARPAHLPELQGLRSDKAINLAFDDGFAGDRVAAFIEGMRSMLLDAYGGKREFYLYDSLDPQRLHYLARNFEIAFWKLAHDRDARGGLFLLSDSLAGSGDLSYARLAGKLIGLQDHLAQVVADKTNRQIKNVIQAVASAVFFPI